MKKIEEYYAPWVKGLRMDIDEFIELAWRKPELHRMMSNENPSPPSEKVLEAIAKYGKMCNRYPDQGLVVRAKLAEINGLGGAENVMLGNGSNEVCDNIFRCFLAPGDEVIQQKPCNEIYGLRGLILGAKLVSVPMIYENRRLYFDTVGILKSVTSKTKMIVIANPNNPTGNFMDAEDFVRIAETGIPFMVDEACVEYAGPAISQVKLTEKHPNVIITRSLSKAYGLAGLRFGYALGDKDVIAQISAALVPWNVGTISMWAALAALEDPDALAYRVKFNNREVDFITESLCEIPGLVVFPSRANFIYFDCGDTGKKGKDVAGYAEKKGIIFRAESEKYGSDGWFSITIGTHQENRIAVNAVHEFFAEK